MLFLKCRDDTSDQGLMSEAGHLAFKDVVKSSLILEVFFLLLAAFFGISAIAFSILGLSTLISGRIVALAEGLNGFFSVLDLFVYAVILLLAGLIFRDVSKGETPFTYKQAKRIRVIAWLLLIYALLEAFLPTGVLMYQSLGNSVFGIEHGATFSPSIKVGTIVVSLVVFFLSTVFKYGVKLQELSDDTV